MVQHPIASPVNSRWVHLLELLIPGSLEVPMTIDVFSVREVAIFYLVRDYITCTG
jgi:hypothetical protein